ncbi:hypothetical protein AVEN_168283-1 [Araneus ventricosus]|uniref:Uncharacterized protein n=1 Tax=Araneus ventricosus TaxID=182803 RepID=A0A4Y2FUL2_ARAVE|nr:hypothetical protein AVEN_168283-1 [Araneus ventricosus]
MRSYAIHASHTNLRKQTGKRNKSSSRFDVSLLSSSRCPQVQRLLVFWHLFFSPRTPRIVIEKEEKIGLRGLIFETLSSREVSFGIPQPENGFLEKKTHFHLCKLNRKMRKDRGRRGW